MKVKIEVSKMISFKRRRCADRFFNAHTVSSSSKTESPSGSNCGLYRSQPSRYHTTFARTDHLITCWGQPPPNRYVCVEPRQRAELYVHGHIFGPKTQQSILRREIEAITIQTGADQPLQPTIVALTSRGEKMESGNCC